MKDKLRRSAAMVGSLVSVSLFSACASSQAQKGDPSFYYYLVHRASEDSVWKLQKAWRTGPEGLVIEEYRVP